LTSGFRDSAGENQEFLDSPDHADKITMREKHRRTMMKASMWGAAAVAIFILLGAGAYAAETVPPDKTSEAEVASPDRKPPENIVEKRKKLLKAAAAKKAGDEEKQRKQENKAKVDKIQRKTGRTPTSWQVLNR
jgi:hypothetical protein